MFEICPLDWADPFEILRWCYEHVPGKFKLGATPEYEVRLGTRDMTLCFAWNNENKVAGVRPFTMKNVVKDNMMYFHVVLFDVRTIEFKDHNAAMLFKLTWSDRQHSLNQG